jgi:hypothetical protein
MNVNGRNGGSTTCQHRPALRAFHARRFELLAVERRQAGQIKNHAVSGLRPQHGEDDAEGRIARIAEHRHAMTE